MASKHALMIFTKAPTPGVTKTRLTEEKGGILTPEEAAELYQAMLLDVAHIATEALAELNTQNKTNNCNQFQEYHLVISSPSQSDREQLEVLMQEAGINPSLYIIDQGKTFDDHFDDAFRQLFDLGYYSVVAIGGDLPTMPVSHLVQAFQWLAHFAGTSQQGGFVQAPCQECGVSLVGYTADTPMESQGVYYNLNGVPALDAYIHKAALKEIPVACLTPVADIDDVRDLAHSISLLRAMAYAQPFQRDLYLAHRTLAWIDRTGIIVNTPPNLNHDPRYEIDL
jgi:glycosyltransferase A (GT-A) superfamily protein (DUF2064 family)